MRSARMGCGASNSSAGTRPPPSASTPPPLQRQKTLDVSDDDTCAECVATLRGHSCSVCALSVAPDGKTLYSGSDDDTVRAWTTRRRAQPLLKQTRVLVGAGMTESEARTLLGKHNPSALAIFPADASTEWRPLLDALRAKLTVLDEALGDDVMDAATCAAKRMEAGGACVAEEVRRRSALAREAELESARRAAAEKLRKMKKAHDAGAMGADELASKVDALAAEVGDEVVARLPQDLLLCGEVPFARHSTSQIGLCSSTITREKSEVWYIQHSF